MSSGLVISFRSTGVLFLQSCFTGPISVHQVALALCSQLIQDCGVRLCKLLSNVPRDTTPSHVPYPALALLVVCPGVSYRGHDLLPFGPAPHPSRLLVSKAPLR